MSKKFHPDENLLPFYLNWQISPESPNYNLSFYYKIRKRAHITILIEAVKTLINISPNLRQTFHFENKKLISTIHNELLPNIDIYNAFSKEDAKHLISSAASMPHDLNNKSSINLGIINLKNYSWVVFNIHHIVMDGITLDQFINDLNSLINGEQVHHINTKSYIELASKKLIDKKIHLDKKLEKYIEEAESNSYKTQHNNYSCWHYKRTMPETLYNSLNKVSSSLSISIFNLLLIASHLFIAKLFNKKELVLTYPINIRKEKINGCFVKLVPMILEPRKNDCLISLIEGFKKKLDFYKKISRLKYNYNKEIYYSPSFAQSNIAKPLSLIFGEDTYESYSFQQIADSVLSIKYREFDSQLYFTCDVLHELFPEYLSQTILERFFYFINVFINKNTESVLNLSIIFNHEEQTILKSIENNYKKYPENKSICEIIENNAKTHPNNVALIYENTKITYFELNARANQIARYLLQHKNSTNLNTVALFISRTPIVIISMLAVLKMQSAYVNLSKNSPDERIKFVLKDIKSEFIITETDLEERIKSILENNSSIKHIAINEPSVQNLLETFSKDNLKNKPNSIDLAHTIYTSGTTGTPKGVLINHKNIISLVMNTDYVEITKTDTFVLLADLTFDAATFEIWGALLNGARLFIPTDRLEIFANILKFKEVISCNQITVMLLTKTIFDQIYHSDPTVFSPLKYLLIGGEALNRVIIERLSLSQHKPLNLINAYGPTENTTISTYYKIKYSSLKEYKSVPIGKAISNRFAFALDINKNVLPPGTIGELYVGGDGLSIGYSNQKTLSKLKFISINIGKKDFKVYKTGDLVRVLADWNLEYLGRNDNQIKLRGYRIELSEIEKHLIEYPGISDSLVLLNTQINKSSEETYLIAYYKNKKNESINSNLLNNYLRKKIPEYMIPSVFIFLNEFPITTSGKLDIKKLPEITHRISLIIDKPTNLKECIICKAFSKVLKIKEVGINNDFFDLGGNSILAIELASILHNQFNLHVSDIFKFRTPKMIAKNNEILNNNIEKTLEKIKNDLAKTSVKSHIYRNLNVRISKYFDSIYELDKKSFSLTNISNAILTGSTGYLGCNILKVLLEQTSYNIYLLIRADSIDLAQESINRKFMFYFDIDLSSFHKNRLFVIKADLEQDFLGIPMEEYIKLAKNINCIIHCAALTKHYGEYDEFYSANVTATINLLEFSKNTVTKIFHFISTISTLDNNYTSSEEAYIFTEDDILDNLNNQTNYYIRTKHEAEKYVIQYRKHGIISNIYRVGNLAFISENFRVQENIDDNAFFSRIKCLLALKVAVKEIGLEEISPVDLTAKAIIKLANKKELSNNIFHVFNPNLCNIIDYLSQLRFHDINVVSINQFLDTILDFFKKPDENQSIVMRFLLHQNWLDGANKIHIINFALQDRTNRILKTLGFEWPQITLKDFNKIIKHIS